MKNGDFDSNNGAPGDHSGGGWEQHDAASGGTLQARVRELLQEYPELSLTGARIKALAEYGLTNMRIAIVLGLKEQTVYNHASKIRKIASVGRKEPFRLVFSPPPPRTKTRPRMMIKINPKKMMAGKLSVNRFSRNRLYWYKGM